MSRLGARVRERTDALDALGNTTAATGKGFAIGSAALTALALLAAYVEEVRSSLLRTADYGGKIILGNIETTTQKIMDADITHLIQIYDVSLLNPKVLTGLFIGAVMAFFFCALTMRAVGRAAFAIVEEVRRQFRQIPGLMEGKATADYGKCVGLATKGAQREMALPSLLAIVVPIGVGLLLGVPGVMGLLAGGLSAGFVLAIMMANAGGAWDNAKKYIEAGNLGGKGSDPHKATVIGDTVGDPFKDTSGPSLNILIKLMSMVSIVVAGLVVKFEPVIGKFLGLH
jgi:K(+)-stimulated pyrophosphate-energized sodium pump